MKKRAELDTVGETLRPIRAQHICYHAGSILGRCPTEVQEVLMCLFPQPVPPIPADTARVAHAAFPKGALAIRIRDELGTINTPSL